MAAHLPTAEESDIGCGLPEVATAAFGFADHHGIYAEPTFQSILLRALLGGARPRPPQPVRRGPVPEIVAPPGPAARASSREPAAHDRRQVGGGTTVTTSAIP
jgi:hypothetical protein